MVSEVRVVRTTWSMPPCRTGRKSSSHPMSAATREFQEGIKLLGAAAAGDMPTLNLLLDSGVDVSFQVRRICMEEV